MSLPARNQTGTEPTQPAGGTPTVYFLHRGSYRLAVSWVILSVHLQERIPLTMEGELVQIYPQV
jgi:hypothetical protein